MPGTPEPDFDTSMTLTEEVVAEYDVGTYLTGFAGRYWVRISAGVFNEKEDYIKLKEALLDKCSKYK